ncbi:MAG: MerR family DNA-binding protein, partial [Aggregatilineales bacterium]
DESVFQYLKLIHLAKATGFSLEEIRDVFMIETQDWRKKSEQQIASLKQQITVYQQMILKLEQAIECDCETPLTCSKISL